MDSILKRFSYEQGRIFDVERTPEGLEFSEACDLYFKQTLSVEEVKQLCAELLAVVGVATQQWQPIETAPKDGETHILVTDGKNVHEVEWCGWWRFPEAPDYSVAEFTGATHWQPLPEPPQ